MLSKVEKMKGEQESHRYCPAYIFVSVYTNDRMHVLNQKAFWLIK